jgi:hypothetical protein
VLGQDQRLVQVHSRAGDIWHERLVSAGVLELDDPPLRLEVDDIYGAPISPPDLTKGHAQAERFSARPRMRAQ